MQSIKDAPQVVEFNAWRITNIEALARAFFHDVGLAIGRGVHKNRRRIAARWSYYGEMVSTGTTLTATLSKAVPILLIVLSLLGFGSFLKLASWVSAVAKTLWAMLAVLAIILLGASGPLAKHVASLLIARQRIKERTLDEVKSQLKDDLKHRASRLVVVIDDIDRLAPSELQLVFQLVKANADFPRLVYLLLYDRRQVEANLNRVGLDGRPYLEKIVQIEYRVPLTDQETLDKLVSVSVEQVASSIGGLSKEQKYRWFNLYFDGLYHLFPNLRAVYRHLTSLSFHIGVLTSRGVLEVDPIDLAALEAVRLSEPLVYSRIARSKDTLTGVHQEGREAETRSAVEDIVSPVTERGQDAAKAVVRHLFPQVGWVFGDLRYSSVPLDEWLVELRVCHPQVFLRYFQLQIPAGEVQQADLRELMAGTADRSRILAKLRNLQSQGLLEVAIKLLDSYKDKVELGMAPALIVALSDVADELTTAHEFMGFDASLNAHRVVYWILRRYNDPVTRGRLLRELFEHTSGLIVPQGILYSEQRTREVQDRSSESLVSDEDYEALCVSFARLVNQLAENQPLVLAKNRRLGQILFTWQKVAGNKPIGDWIERVLSAPGGPIELLKSFTQTTMSAGLGERVARTKKYLQLTNLERYMSVEELQRRLAGTDRNLLDTEGAEAVQAFEEALERRKNGKRDDDPWT
jgi:hypothetical protein